MMNDYLKPEDTRLLDRLVDGELDDARRRELLQALDRTPDGWRRCALAFLENQAWRGEARNWSSGPPEVAVRPTPVVVARRGWFGSTPWVPSVLAACLVVALGAWLVVKDGQELQELKIPDGGSVVMTTEPPVAPRPNPRAARPAVPANMQLVVGGGPNQAGEVVEVPLVDAARLNEALFGSWSQTVPPEVLEMLERAGHQVVRERRLVPIDLRDGRRVVVPMDQVEIVPVGARGYQ